MNIAINSRKRSGHRMAKSISNSSSSPTPIHTTISITSSNPDPFIFVLALIVITRHRILCSLQCEEVMRLPATVKVRGKLFCLKFDPASRASATHLYDPSVFEQLPPLKHKGEVVSWHSSTSTWQFSPFHPAAQSHQ